MRRVIYLRQGRIQFDGSVEGGIELYEKDCRMTALSWTGTKEEDWPIHITDCKLFDGNGVAKTMFEFGDRMIIRLNYELGPEESLLGHEACHVHGHGGRVNVGQVDREKELVPDEDEHANPSMICWVRRRRAS